MPKIDFFVSLLFYLWNLKIMWWVIGVLLICFIGFEFRVESREFCTIEWARLLFKWDTNLVALEKRMAVRFSEFLLRHRANYKIQYFLPTRGEMSKKTIISASPKGFRNVRQNYWLCGLSTSLVFIIAFSSRLQVISTGTIFPFVMQSSIKAPNWDPSRFLSSLDLN